MKSIILFFLLLPSFLFAQTSEGSKTILPFKDSVIEFQKTVNIQPGTKQHFYDILEWCCSDYENVKSEIKVSDAQDGVIIGTESFAFVPSMGDLTYMIKFTFRIDILSTRYRIKLNNFMSGMNMGRGTEVYIPLDKAYTDYINSPVQSAAYNDKFFTQFNDKITSILSSLIEHVKKSTLDTF